MSWLTTTRTTRRLGRWGAVRVARRVGVSAPVVGAFFALGALAAAIRRKGLLRGTADTALNVIPVVGTAKAAVELMRGRDLLRDTDEAGMRAEALRRSAQSRSAKAPPISYWRR